MDDAAADAAAPAAAAPGAGRVKDALLGTPAIALLTAVKLFAQQTGGTPVDAGIGNLVGNLGIMGVLVWHLWYHTTRTYPEMLAKFEAETGKMRAAFEAEQDAMRAAFLAEQKAQREAFLAEQSAQRSHDERETAELRKVLLQTLAGMRTAVHDVRDTAQSTINKLQLAQAHAGAGHHTEAESET